MPLQIPDLLLGIGNLLLGIGNLLVAFGNLLVALGYLLSESFILPLQPLDLALQFHPAGPIPVPSLLPRGTASRCCTHPASELL